MLSKVLSKVLRFLLVPLLLVGLLVPLGWAQTTGDANAQEGQDSSEVTGISVQVVEAEEGSLNATRVTSVVIEPARESSVATATPGRILQVFKREDVPVAAGEPVMQLDTSALELRAQNAQLAIDSAQVALQEASEANQEDQTQAGSRVRTAEAALRLAQQRYQEGQELFEIGAMSAAELTQLEAEFSQAQSDYDQANDDLARSGRAVGETLEILRLQRDQAANQLAQLEREIGEGTIKAPYAGEITELLVDEGEYVEDGTPVFELASVEEQVARFSVPPEVGRSIVEKANIWIKYGGADYAAKVLSQSRVSVDTQLVEITAELYASQTRIPNGIVTQLPYVYEAAAGVILPGGALQREGNRTFVYLVQEGRAVRQSVTVSAEVDGQLAVEGVDAGAQVVYPVPRNLREGTRLTVQPSSEADPSADAEE